MKAFRLNKCENYGIKNCMSSTVLGFRLPEISLNIKQL